MNLKEVKEYFKNAEEVVCLSRGKLVKLTGDRSDWEYHSFTFFSDDVSATNDGVKLWSKMRGFAKIKSYKKENTGLDKLKQSYAELMEKAEEIKQQMDKLK